MISGLSTPPLEDKPPMSRRGVGSSKKSSVTSQRGSKRTSTSLSHEHGAVVIDGRHKRVWKACERCRMKKTKCDGESPCKRCKDDGLVCTAGSRKKTEFKQLPRGYAEVLENTQYALIATVQKLYTMVRNNEPWTLGEPQLNDRGLPVIHNIAEKLGCIRPSPDLPCAFPEDEAEFAELQRSLFAANKLDFESTGELGFGNDAGNDMSDDENERKDSFDSVASSNSSGPVLVLQRADRASSSESDHSALSRDYAGMLWPAQQQHQQSQQPTTSFPSQDLFFKLEPGRPSISTAFDMQAHNSIDSPVYSDFANGDSPMFRADSPFADNSGVAAGGMWNGQEEFLGVSGVVDINGMYLRQQQQQQQLGVVPDSVATGRGIKGFYPMGGYVPGADGTIRPGLLDGRLGPVMGGLGDVTWGMEYEAMNMA